MEMNQVETPCVKWTPDCQGKWDYDGRVISFSSRYWPRGGGVSISTVTAGKVTFETNQDKTIKPSAKAAVMLNFGNPDENGYGDYRDLITQNFEGETEDEVKQQVEQWVAEKFDRIVRIFSEASL